MKHSRRLSLKSESLTELTLDDLAAVAGGAEPITQWNVCDFGNSYFACSFRCEWTFNTCAS